jgi:hypothetical protein
MKGQVWATRTRRTKVNAWMPDKCFVHLEGEPSGGLLSVNGFSAEPQDTAWKKWPAWKRERLLKYLSKIGRQWSEDYGLGWKLEIREV